MCQPWQPVIPAAYLTRGLTSSVRYTFHHLAAEIYMTFNLYDENFVIFNCLFLYYIRKNNTHLLCLYKLCIIFTKNVYGYLYFELFYFFFTFFFESCYIIA